MKPSVPSFIFSCIYAEFTLFVLATPEYGIARVSTLVAGASFYDAPKLSWHTPALVFGCLALFPLIVVDGERAARALATAPKQNAAQFYYPHWLMLPFVAFVISPFLLPAITKAIGPYAGVVLYPLWPVAGLSVLAFNTAAAQIDAHNQGRKVRLHLLNALYLSGGFLGVVAARRLFRDSPVLDELLEGFPSWMPYLMAIHYGSRFYPGLF